VRLREKYLLYGIGGIGIITGIIIIVPSFGEESYIGALTGGFLIVGGLLTFSSASGGVYSKDEVKLNEMRT